MKCEINRHLRERRANIRNRTSMIFCYRRLLHSSLGHGWLSGWKSLGSDWSLNLGGLGEGSLSVLLSVLLGHSFGGLGFGGGLLGGDILKRKTNEGLLKSLGSSSSLLSVSLGLALLVHLSPSLGPVKLDGSDSLSEERSNLVADEEVNLAVLGNESLALAWVDTVLSELAKFSLDNHLSTTKEL
jgi:hypothetical protein